MKRLITIFVLSVMTATTTIAGPTIDDFKNYSIEGKCIASDNIYGVASGVAVGAAIGVSSIVGSPVFGAAAGTRLTWKMAFSKPFVNNATKHSAIMGGALIGPLFSYVNTLGICVSRNLWWK